MKLNKNLDRSLYRDYNDIVLNIYDDSNIFDNLLLERIIIKKYFFYMYFFLSGFSKATKLFFSCLFFFLFFSLGFSIQFIYILFYLFIVIFFKFIIFYFWWLSFYFSEDFLMYSYLKIYFFYRLFYSIFIKIKFDLKYWIPLILYYLLFIFYSFLFIIKFIYLLFFKNLQFNINIIKFLYLYIIYLYNFYLYNSYNSYIIFLYKFYFNKIKNFNKKIIKFLLKILQFLKFLYFLSLRKNFFVIEDTYYYQLWYDIENTDSNIKKHKPRYKFKHFHIERFYFGINYFIRWCFYRLSYEIIIPLGLFIHYYIWIMRIYDLRVYTYMYYTLIERFFKWLKYVISILFFKKNYQKRRRHIFYDLYVYFIFFLWYDLFIYFFRINMILEFFFFFFKKFNLIIKDKLKYLLFRLFITHIINYIFFIKKYLVVFIIFLKSVIKYFIEYNLLVIRFLLNLKAKKYWSTHFKQFIIYLIFCFFKIIYLYYYFNNYYYLLKKSNNNNYFFLKKIYKDIKFIRFFNYDNNYFSSLYYIIFRKYKSIYYYKRYKKSILVQYKTQDLYWFLKIEKKFLKNFKKLYEIVESGDEPQWYYEIMRRQAFQDPKLYNYYKYYHNFLFYKKYKKKNLYKIKRNNYFILLHTSKKKKNVIA